jgi:hypothetical protein
MLDYEQSKRIECGLSVGDEPTFSALVMAAMRRADSSNALILRCGWPDVWAELQARYDAPGGRLATDPGHATV